MTPDEKVSDICLASIRRHPMNPEGWRNTLIADLHFGIRNDVFRVSRGELVLVSCYFSNASWYAITTRRIVGVYYGRRSEIPATDIEEPKFGNFKGYGEMEREVMTIRSPESPESRFEFETGNASMAPIYALSTLVPKLHQIRAEQAAT